MRKVIAPDDPSFVSALPKRKTRHPPLKKSGAMTNAERLRRHRRKVAREKKLANPKLKAKQARRAERERALAGRILALPGKRYGVIYGDPEWRDEVWAAKPVSIGPPTIIMRPHPMRSSSHGPSKPSRPRIACCSCGQPSNISPSRSRSCRSGASSTNRMSCG
jgi:hypothetical protein